MWKLLVAIWGLIRALGGSGVAISDDLGFLARPLEVLDGRVRSVALDQIADLVRAHEVVGVVVGVPYTLAGDSSPSTERAQDFMEAVRGRFPELDVQAIDEALTTFEAEEILKSRGASLKEKKKLVDAYAAAVILQEFLDYRRGERKCDGG